MNILVTGAAGQLGTELLPILCARGRVTATDRNIPGNAPGSWQELDICDGAGLEKLLDRLRPDLVVNVVDVTNLERNLYLTVQILETEVPLLVVLNMHDLASRRGGCAARY